MREQLNYLEVPVALYSLSQTPSLNGCKDGFLKIALLTLEFCSNREVPFKEFSDLSISRRPDSLYLILNNII